MLIADGSLYIDEDRGRLSDLDSLASRICESSNFKVTIFREPGKSYFERLTLLANQAKSALVTMLGDEDLIAFDGIGQMVQILSQDPSIAAVTGCYHDIKGFSRGHLKILPEESWMHGYTRICAESPQARITTYFTQCALGLPSISYSIMRKSIFLEYTSYLCSPDYSFTHSMAEHLLNMLTLTHGPVVILEAPYVLRDFTMSMHSSSTTGGHQDPQEEWVNDLKEDQMREYLAQVLVKKELFACLDDSIAFVNDIFLTLREAIKLRGNIQSIVVNNQNLKSQRVLPDLSILTLSAAHNAWSKTVWECYPETDWPMVGARNLNTFRGFVQYLMRTYFPLQAVKQGKRL